MSDDFDDTQAALREIHTPSGLTRAVRDLLEGQFGLIWLEGELSNVSRPSSGHLYFSLKDAAAQVRGAMFKPRSTWLRFRPADGMQVLVRARVSLYEARGEFQLIVEHMEEAGEGALRREFDRLKAKLAAEGLFETARKRPLPRLPRRIGVITSATGAALRDVLSVLGRRFPLACVDIIAVPVQGREAPPAIVAALVSASQWRRHDVLLVTRGGGSLEDLWAFNDEAVARAIHASAIPVVSAIGHEIDFTIADFVADLRAATPSAAAELLVPDAADVARALRHQLERLQSSLRRRRENLAQRLDRGLARLEKHRPQTRLALGRSRLDALRGRLLHGHAVDTGRMRQRLAAVHAHLRRHDVSQQLARASTRIATLGTDLRRATLAHVQREKVRTDALARALHAVSPLATLQRGYTILRRRDNGDIVRTVVEARHAGGLVARLIDGEIALRTDEPPT